MQDARITIHGNKGDKDSYIKVHLSFDIPEELMQMLVDGLCEAVNDWQDKIIHEEL